MDYARPLKGNVLRISRTSIGSYTLLPHSAKLVQNSGTTACFSFEGKPLVWIMLIRFEGVMC